MSYTSDKSSISKIAYLGPEGTYSQLAALAFFGGEAELVNCTSIDDVFAAVESKQVAYGVVPIENSTEGAINNTQDCLVDSSAKIVGEQIVSIEHSLARSSRIHLSRILKKLRRINSLSRSVEAI